MCSLPLALDLQSWVVQRLIKRIIYNLACIINAALTSLKTPHYTSVQFNLNKYIAIAKKKQNQIMVEQSLMEQIIKTLKHCIRRIIHEAVQRTQNDHIKKTVSKVH